MCRQALYKFSAVKRYTNLLAPCESAHEVEFPGVDVNKDRCQIPHKKNYNRGSRPSYEWTESTAY